MGERECRGHRRMEEQSEKDDRKEGRVEMERENDGEWGSGGEDDVGKIYEDKEEIATGVVLGESRVWVRRWVRMRGGVQELEVSRERWRRVRSKRVCYWCKLGCVEDERHFWEECDKWKTWREELWKELWEIDKEVVGEVVGWCVEDRVDWLMNGGIKKMRMKVMKGMTKWMYERETMGRGKIGKEERIVVEVMQAVRDVRVGEGIDVKVGEGMVCAEEVRGYYREAVEAAIEAAIRTGQE